MSVRVQRWATEQQGVVVRAHSPLGLYPSAAVESEGYAYLPSEDLIVTMTTFRRNKERPYSEMEWSETEEIKLWASMVLSAKELEAGKLIFYPMPFAEYLDIGDGALSSQAVQDGVVEALVARAAQYNSRFCRGGCVFPPAFGGAIPYETATQVMDSALQASVYHAIDTNDDVMMRGLGTLIRSKMLAAHWPFLEEAAVATFISMEASYRLVLRRLRAEGVSDPTSRDAARFVAESFGENIVADRYFEEYYDARVATLHPESRFGSSAFAPMQADDHLDLYDGLLSMYRYLLIGLG